MLSCSVLCLSLLTIHSFVVEAYILPSQTKFILYTGDQPGFTTVVSDIKSQRGSLFTTPEFVKSCRAREMIETPDFKQRDDTEMMGKTRSIRSEVSEAICLDHR